VDASENASACVVSRVIGDLLVDLTQHSPSGRIESGHEYLVSDFPLTQLAVETGEPQVVLRSDPGADSAEVELLTRLGYDSLLMVPLRTNGGPWGLLEVYGEGRGFSAEDVRVATEIATETGKRLEELA
jgi:GAF domain-containing protein